MLPRGHRLIFVTPYDGRNSDPNAGANAIRAHELELAQQYDFITIADWAQVAQDILTFGQVLTTFTLALTQIPLIVVAPCMRKWSKTP